MRYLIYLLILVVLAIAAAVAAQLYLSEPIVIRYGEWSAAPPLSLALGAALLAILALILLVRLLLLILFLPLRIAGWNRHRRSEKQVRLRENAMQQLVYGNRRPLLKNLAGLAPMDAAAAWWAAQVAEEIGDASARSKHLQQAATAQDAVISAAAKAKLCMQDNRLTEADQILRTAGAPRAAVLLAQIYYEVSKARADYGKALAAATHLREESPTLFGNLVEDTVRRQLQDAKDAAVAAGFWRDEVAAADKKNPSLLALYLNTLWRLGDEKAASEGLSQAMRQHPQHNDILRAIADFGTPAQREAAFQANEKRADNASTRDVALLQLLVELADKLQLPGKARLYGQMLSALQVQRGD